MRAPPKIGPASPFFITANLSAALAFYQTTLGFELRHVSPAPDPFFAIVGLGSAQIMLKEIAPDVPPLPNRQRHVWASWDAFIYVDDPAAFAASLARNSPPASADARATDDGLFGFTVADADGYVLFFGRPA